MATVLEVKSGEKIVSFGDQRTISSKKLPTENIFSNMQKTVIVDPIEPKRISKESANCLTMRSTIKAVVVFLSTVGGYYAAKNSGVFSYFGLKSKNPNPKDVNSEIIKSEKNLLSIKADLKTARRANNPLVNQITQTHKAEDRTVKFEEIKVEEFKDFSNVKKKNGKNRRSSSRRSISIQNPIPDQNAIVEKPFNLTIDGTNVFSSIGPVFLELTNIPTWINFLPLNPNPTFKSSYGTPGGLLK